MMPDHTKCCNCHADLMLQNATPLRKSAPGPPNISDEHVSCTTPATENASCQILFICPTPAILLDMLQNLHVLLTSDKVPNPLRLPGETTSEHPKVVRTPQFFALDFEMCFSPQQRALFRHLNFRKLRWYILTWKCASRHNGVHFFDISTSKSGPRQVWFVHFDFETCFAPQRRALFRHHSFQK